MRVFDNMKLRKIFGPKKKVMSGNWRNVCGGLSS